MDVTTEWAASHGNSDKTDTDSEDEDDEMLNEGVEEYIFSPLQHHFLLLYSTFTFFQGRCFSSSSLPSRRRRSTKGRSSLLFILIYYLIMFISHMIIISDYKIYRFTKKEESILEIFLTFESGSSKIF
jgi:hypothetical protein